MLTICQSSPHASMAWPQYGRKKSQLRSLSRYTEQARLMATLGSKSGLGKKVKRQQIFDVNIPKACKTILQPDAPMALRLQGSLL